MNDFGRDVGQIVGRLGMGGSDNSWGEEGRIKAGEISQTVAEVGGNAVNCYPGEPGAGCFPLAYFISLKNPEFISGRGHLSCKDALKKLVEHFTGSCKGRTKAGVFITDNWDPVAFYEWRQTILNIQKECHIEFYFVVNGHVLNLPI